MDLHSRRKIRGWPRGQQTREILDLDGLREDGKWRAIVLPLHNIA
jgi:hypothetical protein